MMLSLFLMLASMLGTLPPTKALEHTRGQSANFNVHKNSKLNLDANETKAVLVHNINECGFACVKNYFCLSFNIAIRPDRHQHFLCEVLANDKYNEPSKFVASKDFHHYSIVTPCLMNPCKNSGKCIPHYQDDTYTCSCVAGYTGNHCQKDIDDCSPNPCQNGGKCTDGVASYNCICQAGYKGSNCQTNIDDCTPNPCQNGGTCTDGVASYICSCVAGFDGIRCENNIDDCTPNPCQNGGTCTDGVASYNCSCIAGFDGIRCENNIDDCTPNPCQNGGTCTDGVASYNCSCVAGFDGIRCENNIDDCTPNPCQNGGTCTDGVASYNCSCIAGFDGIRCENNIDDCTPNPCQNGGTCTDGVASYNCSCIAGFDGIRCENNIDDCTPNPCQNNGTCNDGVASYNCSCIAGFDGIRCENNIDDCTPNPCQNNGTCTDGVASYNCSCIAGFDGIHCENSYFEQSAILHGKSSYLQQLKTWLRDVAPANEWRLCWQGSNHGFAASTFHTRCDDKGPTVTIVRVGNYTFGGYTDQSWGGSCGYKRSSKSFLFTLYNTHGYRPQKLHLRSSSQNAINTCSSYGPTFGGGHDLNIKNNANTNTGSYTYSGFTYQAPHGCSGGSCSVLAGSYNKWKASDIEVFYMSS